VREVRGEQPIDHLQCLGERIGVRGEEDSQREGEADHSLSERQRRQHLVCEQRGRLRHAACTATGAKPAALAAKGNQPLEAAGLAAHAQEAVLEPPASWQIHSVSRDPTAVGSSLTVGGVMCGDQKGVHACTPAS
jgi:hypothetical protein